MKVWKVAIELNAMKARKFLLLHVSDSTRHVTRCWGAADVSSCCCTCRMARDTWPGVEVWRMCPAAGDIIMCNGHACHTSNKTAATIIATIAGQCNNKSVNQSIIRCAVQQPFSLISIQCAWNNNLCSLRDKVTWLVYYTWHEFLGCGTVCTQQAVRQGRQGRSR